MSVVRVAQPRGKGWVRGRGSGQGKEGRSGGTRPHLLPRLHLAVEPCFQVLHAFVSTDAGVPVRAQGQAGSLKDQSVHGRHERGYEPVS
jgi:hypothetical protein